MCILILSVMCLQYDMQEEDILEQPNVEACQFVYTIVRSQIVIQHRHIPYIITKHIHAKILVSALERQMSCNDTNNGVVDQCNLVYASKQGLCHYYTRDTKYHKWSSRMCIWIQLCQFVMRPLFNHHTTSYLYFQLGWYYVGGQLSWKATQYLKKAQLKSVCRHMPTSWPRARSHLRSVGPRPSHASFTAQSSYPHMH